MGSFLAYDPYFQLFYEYTEKNVYQEGYTI